MKVKVKMTASVDGLLAGNQYELPPKDAQKYIENEQAVAVEEKPLKKAKVNNGNGKNTSEIL